jgi:hypothetical protein
VNPYSYYQNHLAPTPEKKNANGKWIRLDDETIMSEVTIKAKRRGLNKFEDIWPIFAIDAEEASNMSKDIGLSFMQVITADFGVGVIDRKEEEGQVPTFQTRNGMGYTRRALLETPIPPDSIYARKYLNSTHDMNMSPGEAMEYQGTGVWDTYVFYSDYSPRLYGNGMYYGSNEPKTTLVRYPFPDGSRRLTYRDRRYHLPGFAYPAQFYSPDYSKQTPSEDKKDYRRTLYWNPNLNLNDEGEAEVVFYNNCRTSVLSVDAQGQASNGMLLWTK